MSLEQLVICYSSFLFNFGKLCWNNMKNNFENEKLKSFKIYGNKEMLFVYPYLSWSSQKSIKLELEDLLLTQTKNQRKKSMEILSSTHSERLKELRDFWCWFVKKIDLRNINILGKKYFKKKLFIVNFKTI